MSNPDQPNTRGNPDPSANQSKGKESEESGSTDFGSFVSSSVRSSFRQLKRESDTAKSTGEPVTPPASSTRRVRPRNQDSNQEPARTVRSAPVGRKWRDAVGSSSARQQAETSSAQIPDDEQTEDSRFDPGDWFRQTFFDEDGPSRKLFAAIAALIVIILLVIYLMVQGGGDGDGDGGGGDDLTPTATDTNVITTDRTSTPPADTEPEITEETEPETPAPTATEEDFDGGDNQRN